jgi:hypothetical protein
MMRRTTPRTMRMRERMMGSDVVHVYFDFIDDRNHGGGKRDYRVDRPPPLKLEF